jgi:hypothetical protein
VSRLDGADEAGRYLKGTALRDFGPPTQTDEDPCDDDLDGGEAGADLAGDDAGGLIDVALRIDRADAPVPNLLRYALLLVGLKSYGPGEKVAWWVNFTYQSEDCTLAYQKFGLLLYLRTSLRDAKAEKRLREIAKKLRSATTRVEKVILAAAPDLLTRGAATVVNQHYQLHSAYQYFRERAMDPEYIPDVTTIHKIDEHGRPVARSFTFGSRRMQQHAFHDLVAAISSYLSLLEHDLVLSLAFVGFDPESDDLTAAIGSRWGEKFDRVLGSAPDAERYHQRLTAVVERWRNPYSHGGFEKGQTATIYLHAPDVGAVPVGLNDVRKSPLFTLLPANETDIAEVFALFDQLDAWRARAQPQASQWIDSGLDVRFDAEFRGQAAEAIANGDFERFVKFHEYRQERLDNMDI